MKEEKAEQAVVEYKNLGFFDYSLSFSEGKSLSNDHKGDLPSYSDMTRGSSFLSKTVADLLEVEVELAEETYNKLSS